LAKLLDIWGANSYTFVCPLEVDTTEAGCDQRPQEKAPKSANLAS